MYYKADIGIFGGSGFYDMGSDYRNVDIDSKYGKPSGPVSLYSINGKTVAFMPRHGKGHVLAPSEINYRANVDIMAKLGVKAILSPNCVGSFRADYKPGDFVVTDQYINFTSGRKDTYVESPNIKHVSSADPYDADLRAFALEEGRALGLNVHDGGTTVVINGPRFSTRAESKMFAWMGGDLINMTQYPECYLCQEKGIPVVNVALVTDYDAGLDEEPGIKPVTEEQVAAILDEKTKDMKALMLRMIERIGRK